MILLLWLPFGSAFAVSGRALKASGEVIGSRRHLFLGETTDAVADATATAVTGDGFWQNIAIQLAGNEGLFMFTVLFGCGTLFKNSITSELRLEILQTNRHLENRLDAKLANMDTKLDTLTTAVAVASLIISAAVIFVPLSKGT
jgi:hypothetical protein